MSVATASPINPGSRPVGATKPVAPVAPAGATAPTVSPRAARQPAANGCAPSSNPCSILKPCSSVVCPTKDAAGNRKPGWLAAPPRDLTAPRPAPPVVVAQVAPTFSAADALPAGTSPPHSSDEAESLTSHGTVPTLSPSMSQDSMVDSTPSLPDTMSDASGDHHTDGGQSTPRSTATASPSPAIRFGALPERPPELRRRNSIALGVLARKNMLHAQGNSAGAGGAAPPGFSKVYMTDDEWAAYQEKFAQRQQAQAVDLGAVMKSGAKNFFGKLRRGSNASVSSNASNASAATAPPSSGSPSASGRNRSDSAPTRGGPVSPRARPVDIAEPLAEEEEERVEGGAGDETPRRGRSPTPGMDGAMAPHDYHHHHTARSPSPPPVRYDDDDEEFEDANGQVGAGGQYNAGGQYGVGAAPALGFNPNGGANVPQPMQQRAQ